MTDIQILIYALDTKVTGIFYVGKTNNKQRRLKEHKSTFGPDIRIIEIDWVPIEDWKEAEHLAIQAAREMGINLVNKTAGGEGTETLTEAQRRHLSEIQKGKFVSEETRKKISESGRGKKHSFTPEGLEGAKKSRIQRGQKPWNTYTEDMTEEEKEAIKNRILAGRDESTHEKLSSATREANYKTWSSYTPEEHEKRVKAQSEGHLRRPKEDRIRTASNGGHALHAKDPDAARRRIKNWWNSLTPEDRKDYIARRAEKIREGKRKKKELAEQNRE